MKKLKFTRYADCVELRKHNKRITCSKNKNGYVFIMAMISDQTVKERDNPEKYPKAAESFVHEKGVRATKICLTEDAVYEMAELVRLHQRELEK